MKDTFKFKRVIEKFLSFAYFCYFELLPKTFLLFWGYSHLTDVIFPYSEFLEEQEAKLSFYNTMTAEEPSSCCLELLHIDDFLCPFVDLQKNSTDFL